MQNMNDFSENLTGYLESQGASVVRDPDGAPEVFRLPHGGVVAWRPPPGMAPSALEAGHAARAIRLATEGAARVALIKADKRLSDDAKAADAALVWAEVAESVDKIAADAQNALASLEQRAQTLAMPAPNESAVDEARDAERRQWFAGLHDVEAQRVIHEMSAGEHVEIMAALLQSPTPVGRHAEAIRAAWKLHQERSYPEQTRAMSSARQRAEWLATVTEQAAAAIPRDRAAGPTVRRIT